MKLYLFVLAAAAAACVPTRSFEALDTLAPRVGVACVAALKSAVRTGDWDHVPRLCHDVGAP